MFVVGLTGGIGSGKSTLAALLAERGAQIIDADELGRRALRPGESAWRSVVGQFGEEILQAGSLDIDRLRLARLVFNDSNKRAVLNEIVHPVILRGIAEHLDRLRASDAIVVLDAALIVELGLADVVDLLIAVIASQENRKDRLVIRRGMDLEDVIARMGAQADQEEVAARADIVVHNDGDLETLSLEADRVWTEIKRRA